MTTKEFEKQTFEELCKEFVLVSQGIEIYRTKSQENAINYVKKENDEWFDYKQKCIDNYEDYADNYIDLEIEYPSEKEKDKEIERLHSIIKEVREYINHYETIRGYYEYQELGYDEYNYDDDLKKELLEILKGSE